jgi:hypothetical protein
MAILEGTRGWFGSSRSGVRICEHHHRVSLVYKGTGDRVLQPFDPVVVIPWMNVFWVKKKRTTRGMMITVDAAMR